MKSMFLLKDIALKVLKRARQGIYKGIKKKLSRKAIRKIDAEAMGNSVVSAPTDFEHCDIIIKRYLRLWISKGVSMIFERMAIQTSLLPQRTLPIAN